jgi:hypothetical protein
MPPAVARAELHVTLYLHSTGVYPFYSVLSSGTETQARPLAARQLNDAEDHSFPMTPETAETPTP